MLVLPVLQVVNSLSFYLRLKREKIVHLARQCLYFLAATVKGNRNLIYLLLVICVPGVQGHHKWSKWMSRGDGRCDVQFLQAGSPCALAV